MASASDVDRLHRDLLAAWNARDASAMAELFGVDGVLVGFDGSLVRGRDAIREHLDPIFADHPTPRYVRIVREMRGLEGAWLLLADAGLLPPGADRILPAISARQSLLAQPAEQGVEIALFQNTPIALDLDPEGRETITRELDEVHARDGIIGR